jgi:hypothetical protein
MGHRASVIWGTVGSSPPPPSAEIVKIITRRAEPIFLMTSRGTFYLKQSI